jgi:hypothetical protein
MSLLTEPDDLDDRILVGRWRRYHGPPYASEVLTLPTFKAIVLLAALVLAVDYAGVRAWVISRDAILLVLKKRGQLPVELAMQGLLNSNTLPPGSARPGPNQLDPAPPYGALSRYKQLSRTRAIMNTFVWARSLGSFLRRLRRKSSMAAAVLDDPWQSPWLGLSALFCLLATLATAAALPYTIAEGTFGSPIVQTMPLERCLNGSSERVAHHAGLSGDLAEYPLMMRKTDAIFETCNNTFEEKCYRQYQLQEPKIVTKRLDYCPFKDGVCASGAKAFELTHWNITPFELGVNSPSKLTLNHRLTCSPLITDFFLFWSPRQNKTYISVRKTTDSSDGLISMSPNLAVQLATRNGPNRVSTVSSGPAYKALNGVADLHVLPDLLGSIADEEAKRGGWDDVRESLRWPDANSFMIVHRAGTIVYNAPVDDPIFSAHHMWEGVIIDGAPSRRYTSDFEATTMACAEQFQACLPDEGRGQICTSWMGRKGDMMIDMTNELIDRGRESRHGLLLLQHVRTSMMDSFSWTGEAILSLCVHNYLAIRKTTFQRSTLLRDEFRYVRYDYGSDRWVLEVETWFRKAILDAILRLRLGADYLTPMFLGEDMLVLNKSFGVKFDPGFNLEWPLCGRVLLRDSNFANINWNGLCAVVASLIFICLTSFVTENWYLVRRTLDAICDVLGHWLSDGFARLRQAASSVYRRCKMVKVFAFRKLASLRTRWRSRSASSVAAGSMDVHPLDAASMRSSAVVSIDLEELRTASEVDDPLPLRAVVPG